MRYLASIVWGAMLGAAATLVHNALYPWGLLLALAGSALGVWMLGRVWNRRWFKAFASAGWLVVVVRASVPGIGSELLIEGNLAGNLFVICGAIMLALVVFLKN